MSKPKTNRVDTSPEAERLTSNPFAVLQGIAASAPATDAAAPPRHSANPAARPPSFRVARTRKGGLPVFLEKRGNGKPATVIRNVTGDASGLLALLKKKCGAGGALRDGEVEIHGDHREAVEAFLTECEA